MPLVYFNKKILNNAFVIAGRRVPFEGLGDNQGVIAIDSATTDDIQKQFLEGLTKAAAEKRGGVIKISQEEYEGLKKKIPFNPSETASKQRNQLLKVAPSAIRQKPVVKPHPRALRASHAAAEPVRQFSLDSEEIPAGTFDGDPDAPRNSQGLRLDGPTREEYVLAGYDLANYPPQGFAERDTPAKTDPTLNKFRPSTRRLQSPR